MQLAEYKKKRDFAKTREPQGSTSRLGIAPAGRARFVVQKHDARRLHYDFRLESDGVLLSWAVPKGPSLDPGEKRLAVKVEDHPLDYANFEGEIPEGEYGAGSVIVWDRGYWTPEGDVKRGLKKGRLTFELSGEKLNGAWHLARMAGSSEPEKENWLLIKSRDAYAKDGDGDAILSEQAESVLSGRPIEDVAEADGAPVVDPRRATRAKAAKMPKSLSPQLATLTDAAPKGDGWLHEIKYDGYRLLAFCEGEKVVIKTRNGHDWTEKFGQIAKELAALKLDRCILDGEAIVADARGVSSFQMLQGALTDAKSKTPMRFMIFDLPYAEGSDLAKTPLLERKRLLKALLGISESETLRISDHVVGSGDAVFENACKMGLEGIICKKADSAYVSKRSRNWLKVKCERRQEFVICGYTAPGGARVGFGALHLGYFEGGRLRYAGKVGTGFDDATLRNLKKRLSAMATDACPFALPPEGSRGTTWVEPELLAEVRFAEMTNDGILRQAAFLGLREDKAASEATLEKPRPAPKEKPKVSSASAARKGLTHPDRVLYPKIGLTKERVAAYYESIAEWMLPYVARRPLSLVRHPRGWTEKGFFHKHIDDSFPKAVKRVQIKDEDGVSSVYGYVVDAAGLVGLLQMGTLEIHVWGSRIDAVDKPDTVVIDLDPDVGQPPQAVTGAALLLRDLLAEAGLESFLKATGGKGLHVVIPIARGPSWDEVKRFGKAVAEALSEKSPGSFVTTASKAKRKGKIFIDYLRNGRGATAVAPFSTRAREGAPVAMPLSWAEADAALRPDAYSVLNALQRMSHLKKDPWEGYARARQGLTKAVRKSFGI